MASFAALRFLGTAGSSLVWCAWAVIDLALILRIMQQVVESELPAIDRSGWIGVALFLCVAYAAGLSGVSWLQVAAGVMIPSAFLVWAWTRWLEAADRLMISGWMPVGVRRVLGRDKA